MKKFILYYDQIRFIWSLGFTTGRVVGSLYPEKGFTWDDETPLWEEDIERLITIYDKLAQKLKNYAS